MEQGDKPIRGDGKDQQSKPPDPSTTKLNQEGADLLNKKAPQAERPNTADKHLPAVQITDDKAAEKQQQLEAMRQKSGRGDKDQSQEQTQGHKGPERKGPEK